MRGARRGASRPRQAQRPVQASCSIHFRNARTPGLRLESAVVMRQHRAGALTCRSNRGTSAPRSISRANHHRVSHSRPHALHGGVDHHAVQSEARRLREVRRRFALAREPVRPVGVPSEIVQQGPVMQLDRIAGPSARLDKGRTADRKQILLVQRLLEQPLRARRSGLADICDPDIKIASRRVRRRDGWSPAR